MIDEHDLRALLAEAADAAPPPGRAPDELLAEVRAQATTTPVPVAARVTASPRVLVLAAAALVAVLGLVRLLPGDQLPGPSLRERSDDVDVASELRVELDEAEESGARDALGSSGGGAFPTTTMAPRIARTGGGFDPSAGQSGIGTLEGAPLGGTVSGDVASGESGGGGVAAPTQPAPTDSAKVVKTGSLVLEVEEGAYGGTVDRITTTAGGLGGYVADSTTNRTEDALSGTITVRVPADRFDDFVAGVRALGTVESEGLRGTEVSAQYTDLEARLRSVTATRERLQQILTEASNIGDVIMLQDRITMAQTEIEQLQGQLRLLDDQVAMGTLSVSLAEPGADQVELTTQPEDEGLGGAWDDARRRFGNALEDLVAWSGTGLVLLLLVAVVALVLRLGRDRIRRTFL